MSRYSNVDRERKLIGGLLNGGDLYEVIGLIDPSDLYDENYGWILVALNNLLDEGRSINVRAIARQLARNGHPHISEDKLEAYRQQARQEYAEGYVLETAQDIRDLSTKRKLEKTLISALRSLSRTDLTSDQHLNLIQTSMMNLSSAQAEVKAMQEVTVGGRALEALERNRTRDGGLEGISWGIYDLDAMTSGLVKGNLYVVAGRPSMGKTWFALSSVLAAAKLKKRVLVLSLEMSTDKVAVRLVGQAAKLKVDFGAQRSYSDEEIRRFEQEAIILDNNLVTIEDATTASELTALLALARLLHHRHGLDLIVVDYLQLVRDGNSRHNTRNEEVGGVSRALKLLAGQLDVPIIAVSQLNRSVDSRPNKRPLMSDLRESGQIEQDADCVIFLYRENYYDSKLQDKKAEVIIGKQRSGATGPIEVYFDPATGHFDNLEQRVWAPT